MSLRPRRRVPCWAALLLALVAHDARAQGCDPETHVAPVDAALHSYTGDEQDSSEPRGQSLPHNCQQQFRLFLPTKGERPRTGWPVLVCTTLGGYVGASINRCIDKTTLQGKALDHGIAVIMAGMTLSTETMTCEEGQEQIPGHGMFHPPGVVPPGLAFAPYDSPDWAMPEKDAVMLVQHVRHQGGRPGLLADVDPHRVAVLGQSAGANAFMWTALGPDRRGEEPFASLAGQFDEPTRPDAAVLRGGFVWWPVFSPRVPAHPPYFVLHFGAHGDAETAAATLSECLPAELQANSPLWYEAVYPEPSLPTLMTYGEPAYCRDYTSDGPTESYAYSFTGGGREGVAKLGPDDCDDGVPPAEEPGGMHPSWSGFTWQAQHAASTRLFILSPETFGCYAPGTEAESPGEHDMDDLIVHWLVDRFAELPGPWALFEQARLDGVKRPITVPGTTARPGLVSTPHLIGRGTLAPGSKGNGVELSGARPDATGRLYIGSTANPRAFQAGVLVPVPGDAAPLSFTTDAQGSWSYSLDERLEAHGAVLWFQAWVDDAGAAQGLAASNALRATIP